MSSDILIFDRSAQRRFRARAARTAGGDGWFLKREIRARLIDRLTDIRRQFEAVLDLGCGPERLAVEQTRDGLIVAADSVGRFLAGKRPAVTLDEEALPFAPASFDLVLNTLTLHGTSDLPGALVQIRQALRPDGVFLAALFGGGSLIELRDCLMRADLECEGGAGPRVAPMADPADLGGLMQRAGFALPVVDTELLTLTYPSAFGLMVELRGLGETNALIARRRVATRRRTLVRAAELYAERFAGADGRITASVEVIYLIGWAPAPSQPRPLQPGSASRSLADALDPTADP